MTFVLAFLAAQAVELTLTQGKLTGKAKVVNRLLADGTKYVRTEIKYDGRPVTVLAESTFAKDGRPLHKTQTVRGNGPDVVAEVDFTSDGAVLKEGGKTITVPYPLNYWATPEFWVIRDHPKPGFQVTYSRFDLSLKKWVTTPCRYEGRVDVVVGGQKMLGHRVVQGPLVSWLDDGGCPLRIEGEALVMMRG